MFRTLPAGLLLATALLAPPGAVAQPAAGGQPPAGQPPAGQAPAGQAEDANPVVARVDGSEIRLDEVMAAAADALPAELRAVPPAALRALLPPQVFEQLLERAITDRAMVLAARRAGLDRDEELRRRVRQAEENELRDALLRREVLPRVTDEALRARHAREQAQRAPEEEVRARHILVPSETDARAVLAELQRGATFEDLARRRSSDAAARNGGDLGFFARGDMVPEFAAAAFALQPGQVSPAPVRTQFGWHLIKVEERRTSRGPSFEDNREALRQAAIEEEVNAAVERVRAAARIERMEPPAAPPQPEPPPSAARPGAPAQPRR
jgi:peptidyl-prolyl cis-trans isomerase C